MQWVGVESCGMAGLSLRCQAHRHMAHKIGNTSGASKSTTDWLNAAGFPGDVCVVFRGLPKTMTITPHGRIKNAGNM